MLLMLAAALPAARAYNFVSGGIYYDITGSSPNTVAVTYATGSYNSYSGEVSIPSTVTYNGTHYTVTAIGNSAFRSCSGLTGVTIPNTVTSIGEYAFGGCSQLTEVTIPNGVETIGASAFAYCNIISTITIPNSVKTIGNYAFRSSGLLTLNFNADSCTTMGYTNGYSSCFYQCNNFHQLTIGNNVKIIPNYAFRDCNGLDSVYIPNSVTHIGINAFAECSNLSYLRLSNMLQSIGNGAFTGCSSLTSITIPATVSSIGQGAFSNCANLTSLLVANGNDTYDSRNNSKAIIHSESNTLVAGCKNTIIPDNVVAIGNYAFDRCTGLTGSLTIPNSVVTIGSYAFRGCTGLTGNLVISDSIAVVGDYAFSNCTGITSLVIGKSVDSVGCDAFSNCTSLIALVFNADSCYFMQSNIDQGGYYHHYSVFRGCSSFSSFTFGDNVKIIPDYAFADCVALSGMLQLPNSLRSIGNYTFNNCYHLTGNLIIPESVNSIGIFAFNGCTGLTGQLIIPDSVQIIGSYAFSSCVGLTSLTIGQSVSSIGECAFAGCSQISVLYYQADSCSFNNGWDIRYNTFYGCNNLTELSIGENVKSIPSLAFYYTSIAGTVTIPRSIKRIGDYAFSNCSELDSLIFNADSCVNAYNAFSGCDNLSYLSIGSFVKNIPNTTFANCGLLGTLTLPQSVTNIGNYAFYGCTGLTGTLNFSDSIQKIGFSSFEGTNFDTVVIGKSVSYIGDRAFKDCPNLRMVYFNPDSCEYMGAYAHAVLTGGTDYAPVFYGCSNLTEVFIGNNVKIIPANAFAMCDAVSSIIIPKNVTTISHAAFSECVALKSVGFYADSCVYAANGWSSGNVFYGCDSITTLHLGNNVKYIPTNTFSNLTGLHGLLTIPDSVKIIGQSAFRGCTGLDSVIIGKSVTSMYYAFQNCTGLSYVAFNADSCENNWTATRTFEGCSNISSISIGENVKIIPYQLFYYCSGITGCVNIPNSVVTIGDLAFTNCSSIDSLIIGKSVASININAFKNCSGLSYVEFNADSCMSIGAYNNGSINGTIFDGCTHPSSLVIGDNVKVIPQNAFNGFTGLTGVLTIPDSVKSIGDCAFQNCSGLTSLTIGNAVSTIGGNAFSNCSGLTSLTIGNAVSTIGSSAFSNCTGLSTVVFNADSCVSMGSVFSGCTGPATLTIGDNVKTIPNSAFYGLGLTDTLVIPNSVLTIGSSAFSGCSGLTSLTIGNAVSTIGNSAFSYCSGLTGSITIPNSVITIGEYAFSHCSGIDSASIGHSVANISKAAFSYCTNLRTVIFNADSCVTMGAGTANTLVFLYCDSLTTLILGENVKYIPAYAFYGLNHITGALSIPDSVVFIGGYAFSGCSGLTKLVLGRSVESIGNGAFSDCSGLNSIFSYNEVPPIITLTFTHPFNNVARNFYVHVPCGSANAYRTAWPYSQYNSSSYFNYYYEDIQPYTLSALSEDTLRGIVQVTTLPTCTGPAVIEATPKFFYVFDHWSDGSTDNPRTIELTQDTTLVAHFREYALNIIQPSDSTYGQVIVLQQPTADNPQAVVEMIADTSCYNFYSWSTPDNNWESIGNENPITITLTQDTTIRATVTSRLSMNVSLLPQWTDFVCEGDTMILTASGAESYMWTNRHWDSAEGRYVDDDTLGFNADLHLTEVGSYRLRVTGTDSSGCKGWYNVQQVHVYPNPDFTINGATDICEGESTTLSVSLGQYESELFEDFSNGLPNNWSVNYTNLLSYYELENSSHGRAVLFPCYQLNSGMSVDLRLPSLNFNNSEPSTLSFDVAYRSYSGEADQLRVLYSIDNGNSWNVLYSKSGSNLATLSPDHQEFFPTDDNWRKDSVNLSMLSGMYDVLVKFEFTSRYGNNLWIDNVQIDNVLVSSTNPYSHDYLYYYYFWSNGATGSGIYQQTVDSNGVYSVTVSSGLCSSTDSVTVTVWQPDTTELTVTAEHSPYTLNGETFCTSGDYTQTLQNIHGCDSVVNLHLNILSDTTVIYDTLCAGSKMIQQVYMSPDEYQQMLMQWEYQFGDSLPFELSYDTITNILTVKGVFISIFVQWETGYNEYGYPTYNYFDTTLYLNYNVWKDSAYYDNFSYTITYPSSAGCDSTVTWHRKILFTDNAEYIVTACGYHIWQGDSLFGLNGNTGDYQIFHAGDTLTQPGDYAQVYKCKNGCDSVILFHLNFIPASYEELSATACDSYTWNGITYTESGDYTMNSDTTFAVVRELYYENSAYFTWGYDDADGNFISFLPSGWNYWQIHEEYDAETGNYTYNYYYTDQYGVEHLYNPGDVVPYIDTVSGCKSATLHLTINPSVTNLVEATACDSYTWNDSTYTASGDHTHTFSSANGCDSVVTLHLTIHPSVAELVEATACDSYTWNGQTYTASGDYTQTFTADNGCDSTVTLHLTILPLPTPAITGVTTVCEGQTATLTATGGVSYLWEDGTATASFSTTESGAYTVTVTNANGCSATASATVTVNPLPEVAVTGNTYICSGGSTVLTATGAATYMWSNGSTNAAIPVNAFGQYSVIGTSAEGCFSTASVTVLVSQPPVITISGNTNLCTGESTTLTATGGVSYMWSNGSTDSAITVNTAGNWQVIGYNENNCSNMASVTVNVWQPAATDLYITSFDSCYTWFGTPRCESGDYTHTLQTIHGCDSVITLHLTLEDAIVTEFSATACDSYTWNGATYTVSGNYTQSFTAVNGNDSIVTLHLTVNNPVHTAVTAESCGSYEWNGQTYTVSGDYTHEHLDANGCTQVDTLHLTIFNPVHTAVTAESCGSYEWNGQTYTVSGDYTHEHLDANGCTQVDTLHLTVNDTQHIEFADSTCTAYVWNGQTYTASGDYTQTFAAANGCDSVVTLHLTIVPAITPVISVTGSLAACGDGSATLTVPGLYNSFAWSTGSTDPAITVSEAGFYWVTATDVYGCEGVSEMVQVGSSVQIEETPAICMVGVEDQHNLVVWEPLADTDVAEYRLYRENGQANIFEPLAVIPAGSGNAYADTTADPSIRAWRYKITAADTCGGETPMSALHKTVHLTINQGLGNSYNLIWTPYEGFEFASYRLYRGTANNNLQLIQTMPSTLTSFTDQNPAGDALFYQIEVVMDGSCVQETRDITFTGARSNIVYNGVPVATDVAVEACESYDWNGEVLTSSGEYTHSFNSVLGYDSVVTLHLTIHQPATSEFTVSCPDSCYTWNGTEYCASGDYTQTLQTVHGCDSVVTLHLTITVGIDDHDLAGSVKVFPNPANDFVNVQCTMYNVQLGADLHVFDVYGKLVQTVPMAGETTILNISSLANGMYFVRVTTEDGMVTKPFVVKR